MDTSRYGYLVIGDDPKCIPDEMHLVVDEVSTQLLSWGHQGALVCGGYFSPSATWRVVVCVTHNGMSDLDGERFCTYVQTKFGIGIQRIPFTHDSEIFRSAKIVNDHAAWKQQCLVFIHGGERYDVCRNGEIDSVALMRHARAVVGTGGFHSTVSAVIAMTMLSGRLLICLMIIRSDSYII